MRDMQDKELHELVNRKLKHYKVPYEPAHWAKMADKINSGNNSKVASRSFYSYLGWMLAAGAALLIAYRVATFSKATTAITNSTKALQNPALPNPFADYKLPVLASDTLADSAKHTQEPFRTFKKTPALAFLGARKYGVNHDSKQSVEGGLLLPMAYGFANSQSVDLNDIAINRIAKIQLYYTDHPKGMDLDNLNKKRFRVLFNLLPGLKNNDQIRWEIIRQYGADTKEAARRYFHGFSIHYDENYLQEKPSTAPQLPLKPPSRLVLSQPAYETFMIEHKIRQDILRKKISDDSTTYKVFERNWKKWKSAVVVCDWTSSMFKYGTQVVSWLSEHEDAKNIKGFVFFNDCDEDGRALQNSGKPGEMFTAWSTRTGVVLNAMISAVRKGRANQDLEENDAEAIQYANENFAGAEEIILIADNVSPVRNMELIKGIGKPVKIIICGTTLNPDLAIQPDYLSMAAQTGGSIHTMEDDLEDLKNIKKGTWIRVGDSYYKYTNRDFRATNKKRRPKSKNGG